jgi:hypothetical protein
MPAVNAQREAADEPTYLYTIKVAKAGSAQ